MCMIITKEAGVKLPKEAVIRRCADKNQDGIGIAYAIGDAVRIQKNFTDTEDFIKWLNGNVTEAMSCVIHFRLATNGLNDAGNRHPFPVIDDLESMRQVERDCDLAVAHNGVFYGYNDQRYSDTMLFIKQVLSKEWVRNNLDCDGLSELMDGYLTGSKLAFIRPDGSINRFGEFFKHGGLYYSNEGFKKVEYCRYTSHNDSIQSNDSQTIFGFSSTTPKAHNDFCCNCYQEFDIKDMIFEYYDGEEWPMCKKCNEHGLNLHNSMLGKQDDGETVSTEREGA